MILACLNWASKRRFGLSASKIRYLHTHVANYSVVLVERLVGLVSTSSWDLRSVGAVVSCVSSSVRGQAMRSNVVQTREEPQEHVKTAQNGQTRNMRSLM